MSLARELSSPGPSLVTGEWRDLVLVTYEIDAAELAPRVPHGVELDDWHGRFYVSIVGLRFLDTRILGLPIPGYRDFEQVNFRFYVRRRTEDGWRRGVVFIKEVVPHWLIARGVRALFHENYVTHRMRHEVSPQRVSYAWCVAGEWAHVAIEPAADPVVPRADSREVFLTERHWGYARQPDGGTIEYRVDHPVWSVRRALKFELACDVAAFYGPQFAPFLAEGPASAFLADGSPIAGHLGERISL